MSTTSSLLYPSRDRTLSNFIGLFTRQKRASPRDATRVDVYLFSTSGGLGPATMLDESPEGVRLSCDNADDLERASYVLNIYTGVARELDLVWHKDGCAGYMWGKPLRMRGFVADPGLEQLRIMWRQRRLHGH